MSRRGPAPEAAGAPSGTAYEAEVLPGLARFAWDELAALLGARPDPLPRGEEAVARLDRLPFRWVGPGGAATGGPPTSGLRSVTSVQRVLTFAVPRPKALLGDQARRRIVDEARAIVRANGPFDGLRVDAAGRDSGVLQRLRSELAQALGLDDAPDSGELRLRVRPRPGPGESAWQVLIRTTPRPLSARPWRVANLPGGLNACVAAAVWRWTGVTPDQRVLNAMCGSGTLAIERAFLGPAGRLVGVDLDPAALEAAAANARAAGLRVESDLGASVVPPALAGRSAGAAAMRGDRPALELRLADATASSFPDGAFDVLVTDPPWGDAVGDAGELPDLYRHLLAEAARVVVPGGRMVVVCHALRVWEQAVREAGEAWLPDGSLRVFHGGHRPLVQRLIRRA